MLETNIDQWTAKAVAEGVLLGEQRGLQMGKIEGKIEGEALALQRLLSQRFGPIPTAIVEQIAAAKLEQIEAWFDAAITAPDVASVFRPTQNG